MAVFPLAHDRPPVSLHQVRGGRGVIRLPVELLRVNRAEGALLSKGLAPKVAEAPPTEAPFGRRYSGDVAVLQSRYAHALCRRHRPPRARGSSTFISSQRVRQGVRTQNIGFTLGVLLLASRSSAFTYIHTYMFPRGELIPNTIDDPPNCCTVSNESRAPHVVLLSPDLLYCSASAPFSSRKLYTEIDDATTFKFTPFCGNASQMAGRHGLRRLRYGRCSDGHERRVGRAVWVYGW